MDLTQISKSLLKTFATKLPSCNTEVHGRQYTLETELDVIKILNEKSPKLIYKGIKELVKKHYDLSGENIDELPLIDIQHMVKELKVQSDGNIIEYRAMCKHCNQMNENIVVDLNDVKAVNTNNFKKMIKLSDDCVLTLKQKNMTDFMDHLFEDQPQFNNYLELAADSIVSVSTAKEVKTDFAVGEKKAFLLGVGKRKALKADIKDFIDNVPRMDYMKKIECAHCGKTIDISFNDFFFLLI